MSTRYAWIACLIVAGCMLGPSRKDLAPANGGEGAIVQVIRSNGSRVTGELLGWNAAGMVMRTREELQVEPLFLVPTEEIESVVIPGLGRIRGTDARLGRRNARKAARYLRRIDDDLLAQLLAAYGQAELRRLQ